MQKIPMHMWIVSRAQKSLCMQKSISKKNEKYLQIIYTKYKAENSAVWTICVEYGPKIYWEVWKFESGKVCNFEMENVQEPCLWLCSAVADGQCLVCLQSDHGAESGGGEAVRAGGVQHARSGHYCWGRGVVSSAEPRAFFDPAQPKLLQQQQTSSGRPVLPWAHGPEDQRQAELERLSEPRERDRCSTGSRHSWCSPPAEELLSQAPVGEEAIGGEPGCPHESGTALVPDQQLDSRSRSRSRCHEESSCGLCSHPACLDHLPEPRGTSWDGPPVGGEPQARGRAGFRFALSLRGSRCSASQKNIPAAQIRAESAAGAARVSSNESKAIPWTGSGGAHESSPGTRSRLVLQWQPSAAEWSGSGCDGQPSAELQDRGGSHEPHGHIQSRYEWLTHEPAGRTVQLHN